MASKWEKGRLADIAEVVMGTSPPGDTCNELGEGIPLINGPTEFTGYSPVPVQFTTEPVKLCNQGDILFCVRGSTTGRMNWADREYAVGRGLAALRHREGTGYQHYLRAVIDHALPRLLAVSTGSTFPSVSRPDIENIAVDIPPLTEQQGISRVLGTLDDKIELNRRMNQTLEAMARAIFKSWFVDFDPVRAKASGQQPPDLARDIADLFPASFGDSELGEIPKGWTITSLGDQITASKGLSYKGQHLCVPRQGLPMHNLNSVYEGGGYKNEGLKWYNGEYRPAHLLKPGDVIVTNTEQGFDYLLIGYAAIVPERYGPQGLFSHHIFRVRPKATSYLPPWFLYLLLRTQRFHDLVAGYSNGTTVNMLPLDGLQKPTFVLPPKGIVERFGRLFTPLLQRLEQIYDEDVTLAALRDALLPKLMSGELRVVAPVTVQAPTQHDAHQPAPKREATDEFKEAVLIAALVRAFADATHPLGRKRYNKFAYLVHRKAEHDVQEKYVKKAAGPYSPWARYQGPEKIAVENGYVQRATVEKRSGLIAGKRISSIDKYLPRYGFADALQWVEATLRYEKNDELELLSTVDFAALDLLNRGQTVNCPAVKAAIAAHPDWAPKLERAIFSDTNIARALGRLKGWFPGTYSAS
jgi:type I restriction enzyme S subunit